jgi:hypothetical protein
MLAVLMIEMEPVVLPPPSLLMTQISAPFGVAAAP